MQNLIPPLSLPASRQRSQEWRLLPDSGSAVERWLRHDVGVYRTMTQNPEDPESTPWPRSRKFFCPLARCVGFGAPPKAESSATEAAVAWKGHAQGVELSGSSVKRPNRRTGEEVYRRICMLELSFGKICPQQIELLESSSILRRV